MNIEKNELKDSYHFSFALSATLVNHNTEYLLVLLMIE